MIAVAGNDYYSVVVRGVRRSDRVGSDMDNEIKSGYSKCKTGTDPLPNKTKIRRVGLLTGSDFIRMLRADFGFGLWASNC